MITVDEKPPGSVAKVLIDTYRITAETISWNKKVWS